MSDSSPNRVDVAVIGGSYAGMAAALQLARARRSVAVIDGGLRRNRFAQRSHGFLSHDGASPADIAQCARRQLLAYETVRWYDDSVVAASGERDGFELDSERGLRLQARRLIIASGVIDVLPPLPGLAERWGTHVFHCPYCHGFELDGGAIGVLANGAMATHQALLLTEWGRVTLFADAAAALAPSERETLQARGVVLAESPAVRVLDAARVETADGRTHDFAGLFTQPRTRPASPIAASLGCAIEAGPLGEFVAVDALRATSRPGIYACGDAARAAGNVALAVGDGTQAGISAHQSLVFS